MAKGRRNTVDDIASRVVQSPSGCLLWTGCLHHGYGRVNLDGKDKLAHPLIYERAKGPIPDGLELDHLCRNPACCNPEHLEPVTHAVNLFRARKTHCIRGHEFTEASTLVGWNGKRDCRRCAAERQRRNYWLRKLRQKAAATLGGPVDDGD